MHDRPETAPWADSVTCQDPLMDPIEVTELEPGVHRLYQWPGHDVDDVIAELGHEPNGVFWEESRELLIMTEAPALDGRFSFDSEGDAFLAYSSDRPALDDLAKRLTPSLPTAIMAASEIRQQPRLRVRRLMRAGDHDGVLNSDERTHVQRPPNRP